MTGQMISVVVPFYNNAELLGECLGSIAAQSHADLEIIMVDDGSTDGSAGVARAQADADPRFRLVSVPNGGPGSARNIGVAQATGEYLAFVDADDMLAPDAYSTMLAVLQRTGSDFVSGGVLRLSGDGLGKSGLHARAVKARRLRTHISKTPELFYDISVWNKLFRRSFWKSSGIAFPEGMLWEDLVAMTKAHVLARSVDVITEPVYHWRDRDKGGPSITQSRSDISNLRDRVTALLMIDDFVRGRRPATLLRGHQRKGLVNDLWLYFRDLSKTSPEYQSEFADQARKYLAQVSPRVVAELPATHKLGYYLIEHGQASELVDFATWLAAYPGRTPPMVRERGRLYADLPFRLDAGLAIPARVFRPHWRDLDPYVRVDEISWQGESIVIEGSAYVPSMDISLRRNTTKFLLLVPRGRRRPPLILPARSVQRPDVSAASGQDRYRYDWSGFRCQVSSRIFRMGSRWLTGTWDCYLLVRGKSIWRPARLHTPGPRAANPQVREVAPGLTFGAQWTSDRLALRLGRGKEPATEVPAGLVVRQAWDADGALMLTGRGPAAAGYQVVLRGQDGSDRHVVPVTAGEQSFQVAVPVGAMERFGERAPLRDGRWDIRLHGADEQPIPCRVEVAAGPVRIGRKVYQCSAASAGLELAVAPALRIYERGRIRRRLLRDIYYRFQQLLPIRDAMLLSSYHGKQTADSPRAIAEEMRRRGDARQQTWVVSDWSVPVPAGARAVLAGTAGYFAALARCRYVVVNDHVPLPYRKRPGQRHVQTWHGTPLKRIGYDIGESKMASGRRYFDFMAGDVAKWDLLLSPNPFSTPIMRRAFKFSGDICETGYPRNDALAVPQDQAVQRVRQRLGLPPGKRVAMYVPTWRDNLHDPSGRYKLDFRIDLQAAARQLAADCVLLIRGHHLMAGGVPALVAEASAGGAPGFVVDVTGYPDINDLLLVTDVLITDYSSVMFDFAPTGKPMLFFTYDLEQYRDQIRGFYFDFEAEAPGPLLATSGQLIAALADIDSVASEHEASRAAFAAKYCPLDDGKASVRACDHIFGG